MTIITDSQYEQLLRVLSESTHSEAKESMGRLRLAHLNSLHRDLKFSNEAPALCRKQA